jgi:hypothetical protein
MPPPSPSSRRRLSAADDHWHLWPHPSSRVTCRSPLAHRYGLSYTRFHYSDVSVTPALVAPCGNATVRVKVSNVGAVDR